MPLTMAVVVCKASTARRSSVYGVCSCTVSEREVKYMCYILKLTRALEGSRVSVFALLGLLESCRSCFYSLVSCAE